VNLGNIQAEDVIALETLRRGLRFETLDLLPSAVRP
jgi:phosphosulfolactate synthase (CoM biosynthesis protein A)